jgi:hypothetical protein
VLKFNVCVSVFELNVSSAYSSMLLCCASAFISLKDYMGIFIRCGLCLKN